MPEPSRSHQLIYQQTHGGVLSYPFSLPAGPPEPLRNRSFCITAYDRVLLPLADLASHVCVMSTTVMHDRRTSAPGGLDGGEQNVPDTVGDLARPCRPPLDRGASMGSDSDPSICLVSEGLATMTTVLHIGSMSHRSRRRARPRMSSEAHWVSIGCPSLGTILRASQSRNSR